MTKTLMSTMMISYLEKVWRKRAVRGNAWNLGEKCKGDEHPAKIFQSFRQSIHCKSVKVCGEKNWMMEKNMLETKAGSHFLITVMIILITLMIILITLMIILITLITLIMIHDNQDVQPTWSAQQARQTLFPHREDQSWSKSTANIQSPTGWEW